MADDKTFRQINVGRLQGLSSYELAVKNGTFTGTEAEYVKKEQEIYNKLLEVNPVCAKNSSPENTQTIVPNVVLISPSGLYYRLTVSDDGTLYSTQITI